MDSGERRWSPRRLVPRRRAWRLALGAALVLVVGGVGIGTWGYVDYRLDQRTQATQAKPGECLAYESPGFVLRRTGCAEPGAVFQVGYRRPRLTGLCPGGNYVSVKLTSADATLCMMPIVRPGQCMDTHDGVKQQVVVECDPGASGVYRVSAVLRGTSDPAGCPHYEPARMGKRPSANPYTYELPPMVICLQSITGQE